MPQVELKYSDNLCLQFESLFEEIERAINFQDPSAGLCKSRAYPAESYLHSHLFLNISLMKKPSRDDQFIKALSEEMECIIKVHLPQSAYYSIQINFLSEHYITG